MQSAYFGDQCFTIFKALAITILEVLMLSLLPKVLNFKLPIISSIIAYKNISRIWYVCMKKRTRIFFFGVIELGHNLDLAMYLTYYQVLCCLRKQFHGTTMKDTTVKISWKE